MKDIQELYKELSLLEEKLDILVSEGTTHKYVIPVEDEIIKLKETIKKQEDSIV